MGTRFNSKSSRTETAENGQKGHSPTTPIQTARKKTTLVVVADNCQAKIYRLIKFPKVEEIFHLEHPESRLRNQDLVSSKPGRSFQRAGSVRYSYEPETTPKRREALKFVRQLIDFLSLAHQKGEFNRLYIIAAPSFLGLIRHHIGHEIQKTVVAEVAKELTSCNAAAVERLLSEI